jgi:hypothetical protein
MKYLLPVPSDFLTWDKSKQVVHICLERTRILNPTKYAMFCDRAAYRGKISRWRKRVNQLRRELRDKKAKLASQIVSCTSKFCIQL